MLQQILRDMWVDPEILAELDETQKQTLFCKMREEQVRRWQIWDEKVGKEDESPKRETRDQFQKNGKKQVQFLTGEDGEPWVWVMGEHKDDKSIETILAEEARKKAITQARQEVQQLRKSVEKELTQLIEYKPLDDLEQKFDLSPKTMDPLEDTLEIYCTVDELRQRIEALEPDTKLESELADRADFNDALKLDLNKNTLHFNFIEGKRDVLQDMDVGAGGDGVSVLVAAWERRVAAARAGDILRGLRARRARALRQAHHAAQTHDAAWRDQERKAKEAEASMREIARVAREAHRRSAHLAAPPAPDTTQAGKPPNREAVVEWFQKHELKRGVGLDENKKPVDWFHGLISRSEAEAALAGCAAGSFLVRVSERVWGYAITYRAPNAPGPAPAPAPAPGPAPPGPASPTAPAPAGPARCKHYLVEASRVYRLLPTGHVAHESLADLINYHKTVPITESGGELLITACPPQQTPDILCLPPS